MLLRIAQAEQQKESEKVPHDWRPLYVVVRDSVATPILGRNEQRASFSVQNNGPSAVLLSNRYFDGRELVLQYNKTAYGAALPFLFLASGASTAIDTQGEIWAYSVNYGTGNNEQAALQCVEGIYNALRGFNNRFRHPIGLESHLLNGTVPEDQDGKEVMLERPLH